MGIKTSGGKFMWSRVSTELFIIKPLFHCAALDGRKTLSTAAVNLECCSLASTETAMDGDKYNAAQTFATQPAQFNDYFCE